MPKAFIDGREIVYPDTFDGSDWPVSPTVPPLGYGPFTLPDGRILVNDEWVWPQHLVTPEERLKPN